MEVSGNDNFSQIVAAGEGQAHVTLTVTGKNDAATDYGAGLDFLELESEKAGTPEPTAVDNTAASGTVDPTLGLTLGASPSFGAFSLPQPLQVSGVPKTWNAPVSNDVVTLGFKQPIGANDALRSGSYSRVLTFTLSTTNP